MDLGEQYRKWDRMNFDEDEGDVAPQQPASRGPNNQPSTANSFAQSAPTPKCTRKDLEGLSFSLGKPLTEEQFKAHRSSNPSKIVGSYRSPS